MSTIHFIGYIIFIGHRVDIFDVKLQANDVVKVLEELSNAQFEINKFGNAEGITKGRIQVLIDGVTRQVLPVFDR